MNLAIEHLQQGIALAERQLADANGALTVSRRACAEQEAIAEACTKRIVDFRQALAAIRAPVAPAQLVKTQLDGNGHDKSAGRVKQVLKS